MIELKDKKFYWISSEYYQVYNTIGQYDLSWSLPTFDLIGSDEIYYAHHFEILAEIEEINEQDF